MSPPDPIRLSHVHGRRTGALNGTWRTIVDVYDRGEGARFYEDRRRDDPSELFEYSFEQADPLQVPGDWNSQRERLFLYEGAVWYQKSFDADPRPGERLLIHFGAACYRAKVWLNGAELGEHVGGFTPFCFDATEAARAGANSLVVQVDCRHGDQDVPTRLTDWKHYGGLTREVLLVTVPETFIEGYHVQLAPGTSDRIAAWVQLRGSEPEQEVTLAIPELGLEARGRSDATGRAHFELAARPELWEPGRPRLYGVSVRAAADEVREEIGFRTIERVGPDLLLNGKPVFLRGISSHEESLLHPGRGHSPEDAEALLGAAQALGCNFIRLAHYPHNEHVARAADRMGLLVWAEIPLYWGIAWEDEGTLENARSQLTELVERDRNRASVILWSISNETPVNPERTAFLTELVRHTRALDPTRLVTSALFGNPGELIRSLRDFVEAFDRGEDPEPPRFVLDDPIADEIDVVGWNEYLGWYYSGFLARRSELPERRIREIVLENMPRFQIDVKSGKPLVISECGAGAKQGLHGGELELWTEEYQARVYRQQLRMLEQAPTWRGISPWILKDFRTPVRMLPEIQDGWNRKGLLSETGARKEAFYVLRDFYAEREKLER